MHACLHAHVRAQRRTWQPLIRVPAPPLPAAAAALLLSFSPSSCSFSPPRAAAAGAAALPFVAGGNLGFAASLLVGLGLHPLPRYVGRATSCPVLSCPDLSWASENDFGRVKVSGRKEGRQADRRAGRQKYGRRSSKYLLCVFQFYYR